MGDVCLGMGKFNILNGCLVFNLIFLSMEYMYGIYVGNWVGWIFRFWFIELLISWLVNWLMDWLKEELIYWLNWIGLDCIGMIDVLISCMIVCY